MNAIADVSPRSKSIDCQSVLYRPYLIEKLTMHADLAKAIDEATDAEDKSVLLSLAKECQRRLEYAGGIERVHLHYFHANCHAGVSALHCRDPLFTWSWDQPHGIAQVLALRNAIIEPEFVNVSAVLVSQIRTNLGNRLSSLGRPIAANEQWLSALDSIPGFAKALINRGGGLSDYARTLYDTGHASLLYAAARSELDAGLAEDAIWESGDREKFLPWLTGKRERIDGYLKQISYREDYDLDQWGFGETQEEKFYRKWCAENRLFINPLNDYYRSSVAATDALHLPEHAYKICEPARFPAYYNLLKQEFISARYRLYRALHDDDPEFIMRDAALFEAGDGQVFGHHTEELRSSLRAAYSIFDKIALFLNDYFQLEGKLSQVNFTSVWKEMPNKRNSVLHPQFRDHHNWPLRGLYFLSRDLLDSTFKDVAEPDAADLAKTRHQAEHRFLSLQYFDYGESTPTHGLIGIVEFRKKTMRMLKLAREAIIYVSLAMHREENLRSEGRDDDELATVSIIGNPIENFERF
jgi:hypothetical protein